MIERTVYVRPPKEANTSEVWKLQKCVYELADATRFWYLKLKEELIKLGVLTSVLDKDIFIWAKEHKAIGIVACFVSYVL